jgi:hypothetical protein
LWGIHRIVAFGCPFLVVFSVTAMVAWIVQFHLRLRSNVLVQEDRDNHWTSEGRAYLGYSFW